MIACSILVHGKLYRLFVKYRIMDLYKDYSANLEVRRRRYIDSR